MWEPPSPRRKNSCPSLPMIPIYLLLCARTHGDGAGSAVASTLSPVSSPVTPSGFICSVCRDLIVFVVVIALKISTLCNLYHHFTSPNQKIGFVSCFTCPIWKNWRSRFALKCTLEWELRVKKVHFCTAFWRRLHAIDPKTADPFQSCNFKKSTSVFRMSVFNVDFQNLKKMYT